MPRHRLGVVLLLPPQVAAEVDGMRRAFGEGALARIPPHVTLVPPVNVNATELDSAIAILRSAAAKRKSLALSIGPAATFLPDTPVLYLRVGGDLEPMSRLRDDIGVGPLVRPQTRPFVPHVTVADGATVERIDAAVVALADYRVSVIVERVHILEEGAERMWNPIADAPFAAPSVVGRGGLPVELTVTDHLDPEGSLFVLSVVSLIGALQKAVVPFAVTARREGSIVGVAAGAMDEDAWIDRLVVAPDGRRQGIGSHLLAMVEHLAAERGCRRMLLPAEVGDDAEAFFRARGWVGSPNVRMERILG